MGGISRKIALRRYRCSTNNACSQAKYLATDSGKASRRKVETKYRSANRPKISAKRAVAHAIRRGRLPRARFLPCFECLGDAQEYHHPSYAWEDRLKVVPLCRRCHHSLHYGDQTAAIEEMGRIRGWISRSVVSHLRVPDRFGRSGYSGLIVLHLECSHLKSVRGSADVPKHARCCECANQHPPYRPGAGAN